MFEYLIGKKLDVYIDEMVVKNVINTKLSTRCIQQTILVPDAA